MRAIVISLEQQQVATQVYCAISMAAISAMRRLQ